MSHLDLIVSRPLDYCSWLLRPTFEDQRAPEMVVRLENCRTCHSQSLRAPVLSSEWTRPRGMRESAGIRQFHGTSCETSTNPRTFCSSWNKVSVAVCGPVQKSVRGLR